MPAHWGDEASAARTFKHGEWSAQARPGLFRPASCRGLLRGGHPHHGQNLARKGRDRFDLRPASEYGSPKLASPVTDKILAGKGRERSVTDILS